MPNENKRPWYKSPSIIVAIIGAIGVIIAAYISIPPIDGPELVTVQGVVTDKDGNPVKGAVVAIDGLSVSTGSDGGYVIRNVPINTKTITVRAPGDEVVKRALRISKGAEIIMYDIILPPPVTPSPSPTPTYVIDTMDSTFGWETDNDDKGSSINIKSIPGRTGNAIEISYDLKEGGYVEIFKEFNPEILSGTKGIKFFYKGSGNPNTLDLGPRYGDGTIFGVSLDSATVTDVWVPTEVPYTNFDCWWPEDKCLYYGNNLDVKNVRAIGFVIANDPEEGDVYGSGRVIIDDVQGITS
jgi:hypothetical protein